MKIHYLPQALEALEDEQNLQHPSLIKDRLTRLKEVLR
jgi:hypothetical protein